MTQQTLAFNRTIVELKFVNRYDHLTCFNTFNRTIVELKSSIVPEAVTSVVAFNRTIVELKFKKRLDDYDSHSRF